MILTISDLVLISDILHKQKNNIVATSGCFDILHIGHVSYLNDAKKEGDKLVVLVNSDFSVKKLKLITPGHLQWQACRVIFKKALSSFCGIFYVDSRGFYGDSASFKKNPANFL